MLSQTKLHPWETNQKTFESWSPFWPSPTSTCDDTSCASCTARKPGRARKWRWSSCSAVSKKRTRKWWWRWRSCFTTTSSSWTAPRTWTRAKRRRSSRASPRCSTTRAVWGPTLPSTTWWKRMMTRTWGLTVWWSRWGSSRGRIYTMDSSYRAEAWTPSNTTCLGWASWCPGTSWSGSTALIFRRNTWRAQRIRCLEIGCDGLAVEKIGTMLSGLCTTTPIHHLCVATSCGMTLLQFICWRIKRSGFGLSPFSTTLILWSHPSYIIYLSLAYLLGDLHSPHLRFIPFSYFIFFTYDDSNKMLHFGFLISCGVLLRKIIEGTLLACKMRFTAWCVVSFYVQIWTFPVYICWLT